MGGIEAEGRALQRDCFRLKLPPMTKLDVLCPLTTSTHTICESRYLQALSSQAIPTLKF